MPGLPDLQSSKPACMHMQILGGDLAGVVESADADSKVVVKKPHKLLQRHLLTAFWYELQLSKGDKVFGLSPDFIFTSKWGM